MKSTILAQETIPLTKVDNLQTDLSEVDRSHLDTEEPGIDCPDCFDTMVKIHQLDKIRYHCENCDLILPEMEVLGFIA